jgi:hypothetical protein
LGIDFNVEWSDDEAPMHPVTPAEQQTAYVSSVNQRSRTERPNGYRAGRTSLATPRTTQREIAPCVSTRVTMGYTKLHADRYHLSAYQHPITNARNADVAIYGRNVNRENQRTGAVAPLTYASKRGTTVRTYTWRNGQQVSGINR